MSHASVEGGPGFDPTVPNVARIYDYMLGGKDNFAADRQLAEQIMANVPTSAWSARQQRAFVVRAVRYCAQQGIGQFLDVGSGLPTMDNVHEVARRVIPEAAVVYVDIDPVALGHARALLATSPGVAAIWGDAREPRKRLASTSASGVSPKPPGSAAVSGPRYTYRPVLVQHRPLQLRQDRRP